MAKQTWLKKRLYWRAGQCQIVFELNVKYRYSDLCQEMILKFCRTASGDMNKNLMKTFGKKRGSATVWGYSALRSIHSRKQWWYHQVSTVVSYGLLFNGIINSLNIAALTQLFSIPGNTLLGFAPTKPSLLTMTVRLPWLNIDYRRKLLTLSTSSTHLDKYYK